MEAHFLALNVLLAFATSAVITAYDIPVIISLARSKKLVDEPDNHRKLHNHPIPSLGGIAIFVGIIISFSLWMGGNMPVFYPFLVAGSVLLLTVGVRDDILAMNVNKKFLAQFLAASAVVIGGNLRLYYLDGFLGLNSVPEAVAIGWTILAIVFIINAWNLIDGVDGLAGTLALVGAFFFGVWFFINGHIGEAILAASLAGALLGFLYYNMAPARIFMGDTGSLVIGLIMAVMAFRLIELNAVSTVFTFESPTVFAVSLLIIPVFDALRLILVRLLKRRSPFLPDRNHIHHRLIGLGFGHRNICRFLVLTNIVIIVFAASLQHTEIHLYYFSILAMAAMILPSAFILKRLQYRIQVKLKKRTIKPLYPINSGIGVRRSSAVKPDFRKDKVRIKTIEADN
jgi:UDP-GlcNAc:undecaprenyl-phosphate/decaprenyl-phosphate GlcNAc-1-phosphate transferase